VLTAGSMGAEREGEGHLVLASVSPAGTAGPRYSGVSGSLTPLSEMMEECLLGGSAWWCPGNHFLP
jgi:hypothetical protein